MHGLVAERTAGKERGEVAVSPDGPDVRRCSFSGADFYVALLYTLPGCFEADSGEGGMRSLCEIARDDETLTIALSQGVRVGPDKADDDGFVAAHSGFQHATGDSGRGRLGDENDGARLLVRLEQVQPLQRGDGPDLSREVPTAAANGL